MSGQRQKNRPEQGVLAFPAGSRSEARKAVEQGVLHEGVRYVERGPTVNALTLKRRKQRLVTQLKKPGYSVPVSEMGL